MSKITKEAFVKAYAERSDMTVEQLEELGLVAVPCECDYEYCKGWQMMTKEAIEFEKKIKDGA